MPTATSCHKPCTVSGGGKSEISKAITDAFIFGNAYVADFDADMDSLDQILSRDHADRFADAALRGADTRPILSNTRSIGSVIKLLTPSETDYTAEYNEWLASIPQHVKELVFVVKRFHRPEWGDGLAQPLHRRHHERPAGQRAAAGRRADQRQHAAGRLRHRRLLAAVRAATRLQPGGEGADRG